MSCHMMVSMNIISVSDLCYTTIRGNMVYMVHIMCMLLPSPAWGDGTVLSLCVRVSVCLCVTTKLLYTLKSKQATVHVTNLVI